jgi:hypothetical protein
VFKPTNADDEKSKTHYMETKVSKTINKVVGFGSSLLLTIFSGMFAFAALIGLFCSIVEQDFMNVVGAAACGFISWIIWNVRRDVL